MRETCMAPAEFEPAITTSERPQTHALDGVATGIGIWGSWSRKQVYRLFVMVWNTNHVHDFSILNPPLLSRPIIISLSKTGCQKTKLNIIGLASRYIMEAVRPNWFTPPLGRCGTKHKVFLFFHATMKYLKKFWLRSLKNLYLTF
jgi:hypothetical protein